MVFQTEESRVRLPAVVYLVEPTWKNAGPKHSEKAAKQAQETAQHPRWPEPIRTTFRPCSHLHSALLSANRRRLSKIFCFKSRGNYNAALVTPAAPTPPFVFKRNGQEPGQPWCSTLCRHDGGMSRRSKSCHPVLLAPEYAILRTTPKHSSCQPNRRDRLHA